MIHESHCDACDGRLYGTSFSVFDGADAELKRRGVNVICGDGCLDGVWVEGNT